MSPDERLLARIDWRWLRFAPFSLGSLVVVAGEVRTIIRTLRSSLEKNDGTAQDTLSKAKAAVDAIG